MKKGSVLLFLMFASGSVQAETIPAAEAIHHVGRANGTLWDVDYRRDRPGYAMAGLSSPLFLEPGLYRVTFTLRRGHYPKKGLLYKSYGLFRLELWDTTDQELIAQRELQIGDFSGPNKYEPRWLEFSMDRREGHAIEPRVYWIGLANGGIADVRFERFPDVDQAELERKAFRLGNHLAREHLENGFVVSREPDGKADETGDATTYTGFYVASLAWKYAATRDPGTYQLLENGLETLHNALKGTPEDPVLTRFVDEDGTPFPKHPSKDVYTSFFLAHAVAYPYIPEGPLKKQMRLDIDRLADKFLRDDLRIKNGPRTLTSLTPYLTEDEIISGMRVLLNDNRRLKKFIRALRASKRYLPFGEIWPGMKQVIAALERKDEKEALALVIPTMNGALSLMERVRDILREQYRHDLFPRRFINKEYPGIKLADMLALTLKRFPKRADGQRVHRLSDLKVLASNALISLHIVKTAAVITGKSQYSEYYRQNLYAQDELLKTAVDWLGMEDDLTRLTAGNPIADRERRGYLGTLSLVNLIALEENSAVKQTYLSLLKREWDLYRWEDNPMVNAFNLASTNGQDGDRRIMLRALDLYPEDRLGLGQEYWNEHRNAIAEKVGGGEHQNSSREPLPISDRPKDSFLWQRNARRLSGDTVKNYPATDYLFVYWYARAKNILPPPPRKSIASH